MNLDTLAWLQSPPGQTLLAELAGREIADADVLGELTRLRRSYTPDQASAAVELSLLRRRAAAKFPAAACMFFTREALEQASASPVATHRAVRLSSYGQVADLCCGIGGDALAIAESGAHVLAVDRDELRLALATANAAALGLTERIRFIQRDLLAEDPPSAEAIFCDPGRRAGGRRRFHVSEYEPPLDHILAWRTHTPTLVVKLSPGVDVAELPADGIEREFVSLDGELKEAALWCGPLAGTRRRATLLRTGLGGETQIYTIASDQPTSPSSRILPPASFLYEPDPAVIRAGLVTDLAEQIGADQLDPHIAYLTSADRVATPFARVWPVISWQPFSLKRLRASLRELGGGPVTVKKRGSPIDTDALARQLSGDGSRPLVVVLTQHRGQPICLICNPPVVH